ncbi:MAG: amidohydrolase family protein [Verrucomicrobia bacterium]|nr:amidohydrolase family protein [Verrucomicrobiota bacterium]
MSAAVVQAGVPHGSREGGWLPDAVYTGGKVEQGLAFFADAMGRITRFSREPADLAAARRLQGQLALPGLVNAHSHALHRVLRGRGERHSASPDSGGRRGAEAAAWQEVSLRCHGENIFDAARMAFLEMLLGGVTCVGEFHALHHQPDGSPWPDSNFLAKEILRAAHDVGIRLALLKVAQFRADFRAEPGTGPVRSRSGSVEAWVRDLELLRTAVEREYPVDEIWLGAAPDSLAQVPLEAMKAVASYARTQRLRLHVHVAVTAEENAAGVAEFGRTPLALLAEHGVVDKRFTAVGAIHLSPDEVKLLGTTRAAVCACPGSEMRLGLGVAPVGAMLQSGAGVALGTDTNARIDLLEEARLLDYRLRAGPAPEGLGRDWAAAAFHAATVSGARCLGAPGGALEVGRPADFFTVNLHDPVLAGTDSTALLAAVVEALDRRAIRDVWIGARQRIAAGRHVNHGMIVGRFVDMQRRLWPA